MRNASPITVIMLKLPNGQYRAVRKMFTKVTEQSAVAWPVRIVTRNCEHDGANEIKSA